MFLGYAVRPGLQWNRGYRILDYERLQQRLPEAYNVITVPEIRLPVDDEGKIKHVFPVCKAREDALTRFQPLELDTLDLPVVDSADQHLEDHDENPEQVEAPEPLREDLIAVPQLKKRATKVTLERRIKFGRTPNCGGCH